MESNMALMLHDINSAGSFRADIKAKETGKETETDTDKTEETKSKKITGKKYEQIHIIGGGSIKQRKLKQRK